MRKKVVVLGGGTGLSFLVKGLKVFPMDISTIVSVCDDGRNTGVMREEFNMPAVGDIRKVLVALSENEVIADELLNYRFKNKGNLNGYVVGNILLAALTEINGSVSNAIDAFDEVLKIKGDVIPLTEDNVTLMARMSDNTIVEGEHNITASLKNIKQVMYKKAPKVTNAALEAIRETDLIILSMGSIWTSILPNLICKEILKEIDASKAKILYVCNMVTQPGETDEFKVSDHVKLLNKYLGRRKINVVIANNKNIDKKVLKIYETKEQKDQVKLDPENLKDIELIASDLFTIEKDVIRHDSFKLGYLIYSYLDKLQ
jgi:uncharacterized cofD-like protein